MLSLGGWWWQGGFRGDIAAAGLDELRLDDNTHEWSPRSRLQTGSGLMRARGELAMPDSAQACATTIYPILSQLTLGQSSRHRAGE
jgi:hypothetical protein